MKPNISGVFARFSSTTPKASETTTSVLQPRKNSSRQRDAATRRRGSRNMPQLANAHPAQTVPSSSGCVLRVDCTRYAMTATAVAMASTPPIRTSRARISISSGSLSGRNVITSRVIGR